MLCPTVCQSFEKGQGAVGEMVLALGSSPRHGFVTRVRGGVQNVLFIGSLCGSVEVK